VARSTNISWSRNVHEVFGTHNPKTATADVPDTCARSRVSLTYHQHAEARSTALPERSSGSAPASRGRHETPARAPLRAAEGRAALPEPDPVLRARSAQQPGPAVQAAHIPGARSGPCPSGKPAGDARAGQTGTRHAANAP